MIFFIFFLFSHSYIVLCMFNVWFLLLLSNFSRVIWLGDLNYRVALTYEETRVLLENNDWDTLLEKDQVCTLICPPQAFQYSLCHWNITFMTFFLEATSRKNFNKKLLHKLVDIFQCIISNYWIKSSITNSNYFITFLQTIIMINFY